MTKSNDSSLNVIDLFQKWMSTRNPLEFGTQFSIEGQNKTITLVQSEDYPNGKFIDDDGEDFDIAMNPKLKFIQIIKDKDNGESTYYDGDVWNAFDTAKNGTKVIKKENGKEVHDENNNPVYEVMTEIKNGKEQTMYDEDNNPIYKKEPLKIKDEKKPLILKGLGKEQINEKYHDIVYYDVTEIIEDLLGVKKKGNNDSNVINQFNIEDHLYKNYGIKKLRINKHAFELINNKEITLKRLEHYLLYNNYPVLAKDKFYSLLNNCDILPTSKKDIMEVKNEGKKIGYLIAQGNNCMFVPKNMELSDEYSFEDNQAIGFYYTADSYLDVALESIKDYREKFMIRYHNDPNKNKEDVGYQASLTVKTMLAFSCECYLKSLLINDGMKIDELKNLGHSLVNLFTALDAELLAKIFDYMEKHGYKLYDSLYDKTYEANDLTEKFMLDLARNDNAFEDSRYSAEFEKNTDYTFLYKFALALRNCSNKEYSTYSPFTGYIDRNISKNQK